MDYLYICIPHRFFPYMKLIKIFLASSEEMDYDRMVFGNLIRRLNDVYEKRGVRLKLFEWEDYDAAFNDRRKQDEYNDKVRESDVFLALFHKKAGQFTVEEFDVASEAFKEKASPKVYTYLKDLQPGEEASPELEEFKHRLFDEMGHYWCRYDSRDSLQLQFVMQLQLVESNMSDSLKVENGEVCIDGMKVASMDRLKFASANEDYVKMSEELAALPPKIEKARLRLEKFPDDEDLIDDLQQKLDKYNKLKEEYADYQKILFDTAKRVARLQGERITERMRRAMDAFNEGRVHQANLILDEAERDAESIIDKIRLNKQLALQSIEELLLKVDTMMADASFPIDERINRTEIIYSKAVKLATEADYDELKFAQLLNSYGLFLKSYARYNIALENLLKALSIRERVLGQMHPDTASSYNDVGTVYEDLGDYEQSLEYLEKAITIEEQIFEEGHPNTARSYDNIGTVYFNLCDYPKALDYHSKSLIIRKLAFGENHPVTAKTYNNIGNVYADLGDYHLSLEYYEQALTIFRDVYGEMHPETAMSYFNIGLIYNDIEDYPKSLEYCQKALKIYEFCLGMYHPDTVGPLDNIGLIYDKLGDYPKALEYLKKALKIRESCFGENNPVTACSYNNIGWTLSLMGDYSQSIEYGEKALNLHLSYYGVVHQATANVYDSLGDAYLGQGRNALSRECYSKAFHILETLFGPDDPRTVSASKKMEAK